MACLAGITPNVLDITLMHTLDHQTVDSLRRKLLDWFRIHARDLPWRRTRDPYAIWLSEVMLQQTQVAQGAPYYERFLEAFPTVSDLAAADEEHVFKLWEGLGYYRRARNLHRAARAIVSDFGGRLPRTAEAWRTLPGVGRYTAGAVASIAYGERVAVLDGNVKRVLSRVCDVAESIDAPATESALWAIAESLVSESSPGDFNQAMMELGARLCLPRNPDCEACPIQAHCRAYALGLQHERPVRTKRRSAPRFELVAAVIVRRGRYLLGKRKADGLLGGLWEFPNGEVKAGETHTVAIERRMNELFGLRVKAGGMIASVDHVYSHMKVNLTVYRCDYVSGRARSATHDLLKWVPRRDFQGYAFPMIVRKFLDLI